MPQQTQDGVGALIPVVAPLSSRDSSLTKDAALYNCLPERTLDGMIAAKRPGLKYYALPSNGAAQGFYSIGNVAYAIIGDIVYKMFTGGFPLSSVGVPGQQFQALNTKDTSLAHAPVTLIKNQKNIWAVFDTVSIVVSDANYPPTTVPGIVELDGTYYVLAADDGTIRGSAFENYASWDPLNFIGPGPSFGPPIALHRHLNYIVAFFQFGLQFYYNAENPTGSPLSPVGNASWRTGCAVAESIAHLEDLTFFMSQSEQRGRSIQLLQGLQMVKISDPVVDRLLNASTLVGAKGVCLKTGGHDLYILSLPDLHVSLVYDIGYQMWMPWQSIMGSPFNTTSDTVEAYRAGFYLSAEGKDLLLDPTTGVVYSIDSSYYMDQTAAVVTTMPYEGFGNKPIQVQIRTGKKTWNTHKRKFLPALYLHGDTTATSVNVSYTDDDYQTWSTPRAVDMGTQRKMLQRCGSSRERAWKLEHSDNTSLRVLGIEVEVEGGAG